MRGRQGSVRTFLLTCCAIPSPRISWKTAPICAPCSSCSATRTSPLRRSTRMFPGRGCRSFMINFIRGHNSLAVVRCLFAVGKVLLTALLVAGALPASASIAVFTDGRSMKISGFKLVEANAIQLTFKNGGAMTMPLNRIERILDDEVIEVEKAPEVKKMIEEGVFPKRSWRYDLARGPMFRSKYDPMILAAARKFDVDAALISAVIKAE